MWEKQAKKEFGSSPQERTTHSRDGISLQCLYTEEDLSRREYEDSYPGLDPYTRGPRATMYTKRPWTIRQYAGFSTAEESNLFFHK